MKSSNVPPPPENTAIPANPKRAAAVPIKLPNPPDETQPETPKIGSRDAPGG